jgi:hypothetical protein
MSQAASSIPAHEAFSLQSVVVRPITPNERTLWDHLILKHHYLGTSSLVGEAIRYVALLEGRWVALVGWSAAALKCRPRDEWIGWHPTVRWQRLIFIANNSRFLILPGPHIPNLASRVLALNLKRLSRDWQSIHGHPVLLAETFVDTSRFAGTCYKAAGWVALGKTRGFGKHSRVYVHHGNPKTIFVRLLDGRALLWLRDPKPRPELIRRMVPMKLSAKHADQLIELLRALPDPRKRRGRRHHKISILAVAICAVLSGARSYAAIAQWARLCSQNILKRLRCRFDTRTQRYSPPSEPTIRRVLQSIDVEQVDRALGKWLIALTNRRDGAIAIDGKTLKSARTEDGSQVHLLSAFVHQQGITIAQQQVKKKAMKSLQHPPY